MIFVILFGVAIVVFGVAWFMFGRSSDVAAEHEPATMDRHRRAGRDLAGPADAGAEDMATPRPGEPGPA